MQPIIEGLQAVGITDFCAITAAESNDDKSDPQTLVETMEDSLRVLEETQMEYSGW